MDSRFDFLSSARLLTKKKFILVPSCIAVDSFQGEAIAFQSAADAGLDPLTDQIPRSLRKTLPLRLALSRKLDLKCLEFLEGGIPATV